MVEELREKVVDARRVSDDCSGFCRKSLFVTS